MRTSARERLEDRKYDPLLSMLSEQVGTDEAAAIWVDAERHLEGMLASAQGLSDGERMHVEGFIHPMCALFLAIADHIGRDEALSVCRDFMRKNALAKGEALQGLLRVPGMRYVFMWAFGVLGRRLFGEEAGFGQEMHESTFTHLRMEITDCPYRRQCVAADAPEIAPLFCANDEYVYGNLPSIAFRQTSTIARGADRCDFDLSLT